jgi:hypothetical protein
VLRARAAHCGGGPWARSTLDVASAVNNLGSVLEDMGDLAGAKACFERALRIFRQRLPPGHPDIRIVEENLRGVALHE